MIVCFMKTVASRLPARLPLAAVTVCGLVAALLVGNLRADERAPAVSIAAGLPGRVPFGQSPVDYWGPEAVTAVETLNQQLRDGEVQLRRDVRWGYLTAVLDALQIPADSQILVFSKTALNRDRVGPRTPRALYFNDHSAVGWVPEAGSLEVMSVDPQKGSIFYTLGQHEQRVPQFRRSRQCLACHAAAATLQVPGWMWRSFVTDEQGEPLTGLSRVSHETAFGSRWGGTYVTGRHGATPHRGNVLGRAAIELLTEDPLAFGNRQQLPDSVDQDAYPVSSSDLVAHLVLDHQVQGLNLILRANLESRLGQPSAAEQLLFGYLLFLEEVPLAAPVDGAAAYREAFETMGPRDSAGRSLRSFDLREHTFRWRLSYLIYSEAFAGLPSDVHERLGQRIGAYLKGDQSGPQPAAERRAILEILQATRQQLPAAFLRPIVDSGTY